MNDPLLPPDGTPHDDVGHALSAALATVSTRGVRPSLADVQDRARRRQRRRAAAMAGACAVVVLGAVGVLATRHDSRPLSLSPGAATTLAPYVPVTQCVEVPPTTPPPFDPSITTNVGVAQATTTTDPRLFPIGTVPPGVASTTDAPAGATLAPYVPVTECFPQAPADHWRCQGPLPTTADGWASFQYCEQVFADSTTVPPATGIPGIPATAAATNTTTFDPAAVPTTTPAIAPTTTGTPASTP
jgi:hypothetical protein